MNYSVFKKISAINEYGIVKLEFYKSQLIKNSPNNLIVLRLECDDFIFGKHYEEYKYSLNKNDAIEIYNGDLEKKEKMIYYNFNDKNVEVGKVYAYWLKSEVNDILAGPVMVKIRNNELMLRYDDIKIKMQKFKEEFPKFVSIKNCGFSTNKKAIDAIILGNKDNVVIDYVGLVHAGEAGPELMLYIIEKLLNEKKNWLLKNGIGFLMNVNPDEREKMALGNPWYLRVNSSGVDINRNFDADWDNAEYGYGLDTTMESSATYRGVSPESESETKAVIHFIEETLPKVVYSFHCLSSICSDAFLVSKYSENDAKYVNKCNKYIKPYSFNDNKELYFGTSFGSLPHWLYKKYKIPAFDLEAGKYMEENDLNAVVTDNVTIELLKRYQEKHYKGICEVIEKCF